MSPTVLLWLRRDLRLTDNPALTAACAHGLRVVPLYLHVPAEEAPWAPGAASRWWLHHSLAALDAALRARGSGLILAHGTSSLDLLRASAARVGATHCFWNRVYEPAPSARDWAVEQALRADGLHCMSSSATLLFEPWTVHNASGAPYRVFTPYWRRCQPLCATVSAPTPAPARLPPLPPGLDSVPLAALDLLPRGNWDAEFYSYWQPGEAGAQARWRAFLDDAALAYDRQRDFPAQVGTSRLAPHLHWGEIGPRQILAALHTAGITAPGYVRQLIWREFAYHLLHHFPHTPTAPLDGRFARFPWRADPDGRLLRAWQRGQTGIPLVDAGLRELWRTGWMHNRARLVVASFLSKNLRLPWQTGARWFWDTLVDADLANNTLNWQWSAGCGADAAPYFRVFNPVRQGERFDPEGSYVKRWCPERQALPARTVHRPDALPASAPLVDLDRSRAEALAAWAAFKAG